jgi:uncharacterized repeat protein (TIGR03837 family)
MPAHWDLFCRVIDNHGDVGVCWRLAVALAQRGQRVVLWIDDARALAWMAPAGAPGVQVRPWPTAAQAGAATVGDVVVEAFGCDPPPAFVAAMAERARAGRAPVWLNLEYLSAEPYVERSHGLRSPQFSGPGAGLTKWFFYPGFSAATGGLLHADVASDDPAAARAWAAQQGWGTLAGERSALLFCYDIPALPGLLAQLAARPTLLRLAPGPMQAALLAMALPPTLRRVALPHVAQPDFDRLLAASDFNLVRGEDSFVRAQVAADAPFLWQIYPQDDGAHAAKLTAFVDRYLDGSPPALAAAVRGAFLAINGLAPWPAAPAESAGGPLWDAWPAWQAWHRGWRARRQAAPDLADTLLGFVAERS